MSRMKSAAVVLVLITNLVLMGFAGAAVADGDIAASMSVPRDIAGSLCVAIAVGPAAPTFRATRDPHSGAARGITVALAKAAAAKLDVPWQRKSAVHSSTRGPPYVD